MGASLLYLKIAPTVTATPTAAMVPIMFITGRAVDDVAAWEGVAKNARQQQATKS
jgi:hypothetical protein